MPSGGIHLCVAKILEKELLIKDYTRYMIGSIAPDSWRNSNSTKQSSHFVSEPCKLDYDYEYFYKKYKDLDDDYIIGYLVHLITDKYWYTNKLMMNSIKEADHYEAVKACSYLINKFNIEQLKLPSGFTNPVLELETLGIEKSINYLNSVNYVDDYDTKYDKDELIRCIDETSRYVFSELKRIRKL